MNVEKILEENKDAIVAAIKKEFPCGQDYYFDQGDDIPDSWVEAAIEENERWGGGLRKNLENIAEEELYEQREYMENEVQKVVQDYLYDNFDIEWDDMESEEQEAVREFAQVNTEIDNKSISDFVSDLKAEEVTISVTPKEYLEDAWLDLNHYTDVDNGMNPKKLTVEGVENNEADLEDIDDPDMLNWLCQTQGYHLEDLYDKKKVESSPFLSSLAKELTTQLTDRASGTTLSFTCLGADLETLEAVEEEEKNIEVDASKNLYIGFTNLINGEAPSNLQIQLEKSLVIPREWMHTTVCINRIDDYSVQGICGLVPTDPDAFRATDKKPIEVKPANVPMLMSIAEKKDNEREKIQEWCDSYNKKKGCDVAYVMDAINPGIEIYYEDGDKIKATGEKIVETFDMMKNISRNSPAEDVTADIFRNDICPSIEDGKLKISFRSELEKETAKELCSYSKRNGEPIFLKTRFGYDYTSLKHYAPIKIDGDAINITSFGDYYDRHMVESYAKSLKDAAKEVLVDEKLKFKDGEEVNPKRPRFRNY